MMPFPVQVTRLNCRNVSADNGHDLLRAAYQLFSWATFFEQIMFPFLAKRLMDNLLDFNVPYVDLAVLDLEELASIEKYPSIRPLLKFFPKPLIVTDSVMAHLGNLKTNFLMRQFIHSDFEIFP
ncbi:hypothetical protein AMTRI_Chr06g196330 [Amborella trichopoda]